MVPSGMDISTPVNAFTPPKARVTPSTPRTSFIRMGAEAVILLGGVDVPEGGQVGIDPRHLREGNTVNAHPVEEGDHAAPAVPQRIFHDGEDALPIHRVKRLQPPLPLGN